MIRSCYIHIPFCDSICSYCDFCKVLKNEQWLDLYLEALEKEIHEIYQNEVLDTIYIGGGTPSCLSLEQLEHLFQILQILKKKDDTEYTIEGDFLSTTREKLELYKKYGINRLSFGLESINNRNMKLLGRKTDIKKVEEVLKEARILGFSNINLDLIYALPNETMKDLEEDLDYVLSLEVEHISTYSLIIEENTLLKIQKVQPIDEEIDLKMYQYICKRLKEKSYSHYEISNFAKKEFSSRHNMTYWNNDYYYGFGLGASSYIEEERRENTRSFSSYIKGFFLKNREKVSKKEKMEYEVLLNLRKKEGISLIDFEKKYQKKLRECFDYESLVMNEFLEIRENRLFIPENKWYISNEIIVELLEKEI